MVATVVVVGECLLVVGGEGTAHEGLFSSESLSYAYSSLLLFGCVIEGSVKSLLQVGRRYGWLLFLFAPGS